MPDAEKDAPACDCESMGGRFGSHRPECPWQIAFEAQLAAEKDAGYECACEPRDSGGCEARRRGTPDLCSAEDIAEKDAACTCVENIQRYAAYADLVMRDCPAHPYYPTPCTATYDKSTRRDRADTHTCTLGGGHDGPHFCATCRSAWTPTSVTSPAETWPDEEGPRAHDSWACQGGGEWHWHSASVETCPLPPGGSDA